MDIYIFYTHTHTHKHTNTHLFNTHISHTRIHTTHTSVKINANPCTHACVKYGCVCEYLSERVCVCVE